MLPRAGLGLPAGLSDVGTISNHGTTSIIVVGRHIIIVAVDLLMVSISCDNFWTKMMQTASLQSKGTKRGGLGTGAEVWEQEQNALETAPVGLQEGAGGLSFTMVCYP